MDKVCKAKSNSHPFFCRYLSRFEKQNSNLTEVKIDEVLRCLEIIKGHAMQGTALLTLVS